MTESAIAARKYTQNRELSWLKFNERVLDEAGDQNVPLMERLKFISIFTSNLDEFFMIRVGSLFELSQLGETECDNKSGLTPTEQLDKIYEAVRPLYEKKTAIYKEIKLGLEKSGVWALDFSDLEASEMRYVRDYFKTNIKPILSPQIVDPHHPFPHIPNKEIVIVTLLRRKSENILGLLPVPHSLPEVVFLPGSEIRYINTEKIIYEFAHDTFGKYEIAEKNVLCVTRNANINPDSASFEELYDFRSRMKELLKIRRHQSVVRLEARNPMSGRFVSHLCERFKLQENQIYISNSSLTMTYIFTFFDKLTPSQRKQLMYPEFKPQPLPYLNLDQSIIKQIKRKDLLLSYPYESMDTFLHFIKEAADDPNVISIKITIYRLAKKAKLVDYLCAAAENGIDVTVLLELRARFDEQNNIDWSNRLEDAGCRIIYGFDDYKVHSKICLITMKEKNGIGYMTQVGTGNYNEKTSELYTDLSLITANPSIGSDANEFFKNMAIGNIEGYYKNLLIAPVNFKKRILGLLDEEISRGVEGSVFIKINSLTDVDIIDKLAEASKAGVDIKLIVRGICCLIPKIPGETDNITVISVVGRFLEHSRIYSFGSGERQMLYIASADLMTRNTERRVEAACPVLDDDLKSRINDMLTAIWYDNVKSRVLCADGNYIKKSGNSVPVDSQSYFIAQAIENAGKIKADKIGFLKRLLEKAKLRLA